MCNKCSGNCNSCECTCKKKNPCEDPCQEQNCGCDFILPTDCVVTEEDYECIGSEKGEKLKAVLGKINKLLCDKSEPADGVDGDSAYVSWINLGNVGTEQDFMDSLKGVCECDEEVFIVEAEMLEAITLGNWESTVIGTEVGVTPTGFSYTVPVGQGGLYDIEYQGTVTDTDSTYETSFIAGIFLDAIGVPNGRTAASTMAKNRTYQNIYLVKNNLPVAAGQIINLKLASFMKRGAFVQNKFRIIKR